MFYIKSVFCRPKRSDYPLAKFFYVDQELRNITTDLDSFDGNKEPVRCAKLIDKLRKTQGRVMDVLWSIIRCCLQENTRPCRLYREKFPEDMQGDHITGTIWFGAECLVAGSVMHNHERESDELRPYARYITKVMETVRNKLRDQCFRDVTQYPEDLVDVLRWFDYNWSEFEYSYISRMWQVKSRDDIYQQHLTTVLFSETTAQALKDSLITDEQMIYYDPVLMLAIPRLAIISGLVQEDGLLDLTRDPALLPPYFRPHITALSHIKHSLGTLSPDELVTLKQCLASSLDPLQSNQGEEHQSNDSNNPISEEEHQTPNQSMSAENISADDIILIDNQTDELTDRQTDERGSDEQISLQTDNQAVRERMSVERLDQLQCLYLSVSSIADQMITNHAKDLRQMLHHTFKMNQPFLTSDSTPFAKTTDTCDMTAQSDCVEPSTGNISPRIDEVIDVSSCTDEDNHSVTRLRQEPPVWVPDNEVTCCTNCRQTFTLLRRKHHCRYCGQIFCQPCTTKTAVLSFTKSDTAVRVCDGCHALYTTLTEQQASSSSLSDPQNSSSSVPGNNYSSTSSNSIIAADDFTIYSNPVENSSFIPQTSLFPITSDILEDHAPSSTQDTPQDSASASRSSFLRGLL